MQGLWKKYFKNRVGVLNKKYKLGAFIDDD